MTVTAASFRGHFPEFTSTTDYPDTQVQFYLDIAPNLISSDRWGKSFDMGVELFVAHNITLDAREVRAARSGIPGTLTGPVNNRSVDKASVGYDTGSVVDTRGGPWNLTVYGARYYRFAMMFGIGPLQVGTGNGYGFSAYTGPWVYNFPNPS